MIYTGLCRFQCSPHPQKILKHHLRASPGGCMVHHWCDTTLLVIAEVMKMTPTAAMEVLLGLPPLCVMTEAEVYAELCRLMHTQQ
jgi:hypothetical protein